MSKPEQDEVSNTFLLTLTDMFGTHLSVPEEELVVDNEDNYTIFFVIFGDCIVNMFNLKGRLVIAHRLLVEGDHFGEISVIFGCPAQATVIARDYSTFAVINH